MSLATTVQGPLTALFLLQIKSILLLDLNSSGLPNRQMESVLVFGGTGFIGQYLTRELSKKFLVFVASRGKRQPLLDFKANPNVVFIENIDVTKPESFGALERAITTRPSLSIYLPAGRGYSWSLENEIISVTVKGLANTVQLCKKMNIPKLIFIGSGSSLLTDYAQSNPYTKAKYLAEQYLRQNSTPVRWLIASPTECIGVGVGGSKTKLMTLFSSHAIFKHIRIPGATNFVKVEDCANGIVRLISEFDTWERKNVLIYGTDISYNHLFDAIKASKKLDTWSIELPNIVLKIIYKLFLAMDKCHLFTSFMQKYPPHTLRAAAEVKKYSELDIPKLNFPCDIDTAIKNTLEWYWKTYES